MTRDLNLLRQKIDNIDAAIIKKLALRQKLAKKIGRIKAKSGKIIKDNSREKAQQQQYRMLCENYQVDYKLIQKLFKIIIAHSRSIQKNDL